MSDTAQGPETQFFGPITPLAVRMPEELRTNLDILAQLNGRSTTEECRTALEQWVISSRSDPKVMARAAEVQEQIEREANAKRDAISQILSGGKSGPRSPRQPRPASE